MRWKSGKTIVRAVTFSLIAGSLVSAGAQSVYKLADGVIRPAPQPGAREAYLPIIVNSSHASNLLVLPNGDLLCVFYAGIYERGNGESIVTSRLRKGSNRWTEPVIVSYKAGWANQNPVLFSAPDGTIRLFHTSERAGHDQTKDIVYGLKSTDEGHTWSDPIRVFPQLGLYTRQPLVVFHHKWLLPVYHSAGASITSNAQHDHSYVETSSDSGKTWTECNVQGSDGLVQMSLVKLSESHLIAFFRSRYADWIYKSESDDGCNWTAPVRTQLPNNNASIQAVRLKDGHLAMIFNNTQAEFAPEHAETASRRILSIALSEDNGKTWPWIRDLENDSIPPAILPLEDAEYSYPSLIQSPDGMIHAAFTFRREAIKYMTFPESWIKHGTTAGGKRADAHEEGVASAKRPNNYKYYPGEGQTWESAAFRTSAGGFIPR